MRLKLYSRETIGLLALLLSPFLACILFAYNLREIGKGRIGPLFIIGCLFATGIITQLLIEINIFFRLAIVNVLGSILLTFYFWDKYFAGYNYEKKNPWKPTLFFVSILIVILLAQFLRFEK